MPCESSKAANKAIVVESDDHQTKKEGPLCVFDKKLEKLKKMEREEKKKKKKKLSETEIDTGLDPHPTDCKKKKKKKKKKAESESESESISSLRVTVPLMRRRNCTFPILRAGPLSKNDKLFHTLRRFSKLSIAKYNIHNGTNYQFIHYVKAKYKFVYSGDDYTITFEARQPSDVVDKLTIFKATVYNALGSNEPELRECRLVGTS